MRIDNLKKLLNLLFFLTFSFITAQQINISEASFNGRFSGCYDDPQITVTFISGSGSEVQNGKLHITDACETTTLRIEIKNMGWNQSPNANWVHGIHLPVNAPYTISNSVIPEGWIYQDSVTGAECSGQQTGGKGFYFDGTDEAECCSPISANDGDPSNNYGDLGLNCDFTKDFKFDLTFANDIISPDLHEFIINGTSDGNTGCFSESDMSNNNIQIIIPTDVPTSFESFPVNTSISSECINDVLEYYAVLEGECHGEEITWWSEPEGGILLGTGSPFHYKRPDGSCPKGDKVYAECSSSHECMGRYMLKINKNCPQDGQLTFPSVGPLCKNSTPPNLPSPTQGVGGYWLPDIIDTSQTGTFQYTYYPNEGCFAPTTISVVISNNIQPEFDFQELYCLNMSAPALPQVSDNNFSGTWVPSTIDTGETGTFTYTFFPDDEECATPYTTEITIVESYTPQFPPIGPFCVDADPGVLPESLENIPGDWSPSTIDTSTEGVFTFTFTPDDDCFQQVQIPVQIANTGVEAVFNDLPEVYCQYDVPIELPNISQNGLHGNWSPAAINTSTPGIKTYTFTPEGDCAVKYKYKVEITERIVPLFHLYGIYCLESIPQELPTISDNGITGTWDPAEINTEAVSTLVYTFTPDEGICAAEVKMHILIVTEIIPSFNFQNEYCEDETPEILPSISNNGVSGEWSPSYIDTSTPGIFTYTFIPYIDNQCSDPTDYTIEIHPTREAEFTLESEFCVGDSVSVLPTISENGIQGTWSEVMVDTSTPGIKTYTFLGNSDENCVPPFIYEVEVIPDPVVTGVEVGSDYIALTTTGSENDDFDYSLDGTIWQDSPVFHNLVPGEIYEIHIRGRCNIVKEKVAIIRIPNLISPNGDGINDTWDIRGIEIHEKATLKIFNRYGKLFVDVPFNGTYQWNGYYAGQHVPSGSYWYIIDSPATDKYSAFRYSGHITVRY